MHSKSLMALVIGIAALVIFSAPQSIKNGYGGKDFGGGGICTMEAKICPDGSSVGRIGPNCEFAACSGGVGRESGLNTGGAKYNSGIRGTVLLGPTCPVVRDPPDPACADKPYATLVAIFRPSDSAHAVVITESDENGAFFAEVPPGDYVIGAGESALPRCAQTSVTVQSSGYTNAVVYCDSGIR